MRHWFSLIATTSSGSPIDSKSVSPFWQESLEIHPNLAQFPKLTTLHCTFDGHLPDGSLGVRSLPEDASNLSGGELLSVLVSQHSDLLDAAE